MTSLINMFTLYVPGLLKKELLLISDRELKLLRYLPISNYTSIPRTVISMYQGSSTVEDVCVCKINFCSEETVLRNFFDLVSMLMKMFKSFSGPKSFEHILTFASQIKNYNT